MIFFFFDTSSLFVEPFITVTVSKVSECVERNRSLQAAIRAFWACCHVCTVSLWPTKLGTNYYVPSVQSNASCNSLKHPFVNCSTCIRLSQNLGRYTGDSPGLATQSRHACYAFLRGCVCVCARF